ncbi:hypothetical protein DM01DRAFT_1280611 [Hesseltinella vesiculosa]|uniref:SWIRM-domain-containing protein n=1 Tax=Hesseltinella vesiculosa TaxID=101127 RepID=A0A1X2GUE0_9FUNG|nr:hypothetical protein DM01DRAFT_1280611 [Hesseltinella vesiculosa]
MNEEDYEDVDDDIESTDHHKAEEDEEEIDESDDGLQHSDDGEDEDEDEDEDDEEEEEEEDKPQGRPLASKKPVPVHDPEANLPILDRSAQPRVLECDREAERIHAESIRSRKTEYEPYANGEIINLSQFTPDAYTLPYITPVTKKDVVKDEKSIETYAHASPIKDSTLFTPSWLDLHEVHEVEKNAMPEWFSSKRRQQEYISYRNHYVQQYHASPNNYLLAMSCKQAFPSADLVQLMKIHRFLELHNIINAQIDPRRHWCNPVVDGPHDAYVSVNIPRQLDDINSSVDMGYLRRLMYDPARLKKIPSHWPFHKEPVVCNTCRISCHDLRYQHYLYHDVHVCVNCFVQGKFSMAYSSGDFIHVEGDPEEELRLLQQSQDAMDEEWTNEEILRLLEGIEKYDDDWLLVSEHVGNRTKEQCITQFLQMPITDDVLSTTLSAKEQDELPFGCTNNPIMTLVTFLTAHVNPGVGASAAKAAAKVLMQDGAAKTQDTSLPDHSTSTAKDDDEGEWVDMSMDVDPKTEPMDSQPSAEETPVEANDHEADDDYFSDQATSDALRGALKAASHQARLLSNYEDQEIQHWVRLAVKTVQDKLSLKLQQLEELDKSVHVEYMDIEDQEASILAAIDNSKKEYSTLVGNGDTPAASSSTNDSASSVPPNFAA